jgi:hypothetical protein
MYQIRKLKPAPFNKEILVGPIALLIFFFLMKTSGPQAAYIALIPFMLLMSMLGLLIYLRTKNAGHIILAGVGAAGVLMALLFGIYGRDVSKPLMGAVILLLVILLPILLYMTFTRKNKWRTREMLELAAFPVKDIESGFTERPMPVGKADFTHGEMEAFTEFMRRNLIGIPVYDEDKIIFVINYNYTFLMGFNNEYKDKTYVSFDPDGNVLAHISLKDYMKYRDRYAFDQLCESMGKLVIEFLDLYKKGEGQRVIDQLNDLQLNPFT